MNSTERKRPVRKLRALGSALFPPEDIYGRYYAAFLRCLKRHNLLKYLPFERLSTGLALFFLGLGLLGFCWFSFFSFTADPSLAAELCLNLPFDPF